MEDPLSREPEAGRVIADASRVPDPGVGVPVGVGPVESAHACYVQRRAVPRHPGQPAGPPKVSLNHLRPVLSYEPADPPSRDDVGTVAHAGAQGMPVSSLAGGLPDRTTPLDV